MKLVFLLVHSHFELFIEKLTQNVEHIELGMVDCRQVELLSEQVFIFLDNVNF